MTRLRLPILARDALLLTLACTLSGWAAELWLHAAPFRLALLWLPVGLLTAALCLRDVRLWPMGLLAALLVNLPFAPSQPLAQQLGYALTYAGADCLTALLAWQQYRRYAPEHPLDSLRHCRAFLLRVALLPPLLVMWPVPLLLELLGSAPTDAWLQSWLVMALSDSFAILLVMPLALAWLEPAPSAQQQRMLPALAGFTLLLALFYPLAVHYLFLLIPALLLLGTSGGLRAMTLGQLLLVIMLLLQALHGVGLVGGVSPAAAWLPLLVFLLAALASGLLFISVLREGDLLRSQLERTVQARTQALDTLMRQQRELAATDALTGLLNRRAFSDRINAELGRMQRLHCPAALLLLDIDHFKLVNDQYGHQCGDQVLRQLAARCRDTLRRADSMARIGGEEFAILLPDTQLDEAMQVADKLRSALEADVVQCQEQAIRYTVSIGVASLNGGFDLAYNRADHALYRAKQLGRNRVELAR